MTARSRSVRCSRCRSFRKTSRRSRPSTPKSGGTWSSGRRRNEMKYMLLVYGNEQAWDEAEREQCYKDSAQVAHDLRAAGLDAVAAPLHPVATATSVRVREGKRFVTDGPFAETPKHPGGS